MATQHDSPTCPGSATFPDVVNDPILGELTYVCAICGASVPNFEPVSVHRHALRVDLRRPSAVKLQEWRDQSCGGQRAPMTSGIS